MIAKTKLYTKQQIQEAISFWTKILENTSPLIDALVEDFGYDVVFGKKKILPTFKMIETIYDLINLHIFSNKLKRRQIEEDRFGQCKKDNAAMEYYSVLYTDSTENPTKYILLNQIGQDSDENIYYPPRIFVADSIFDEKMSIITLASIIAHEMIHQYIIENSDGANKQYDADYNGIPYDEHSGEFKEWMDKINSKFGLNIQERGSANTYDNDTIDALKKFAGSDYNVNESVDSISLRKEVHYENGYVELRFL